MVVMINKEIFIKTGTKVITMTIFHRFAKMNHQWRQITFWKKMGNNLTKSQNSISTGAYFYGWNFDEVEEIDKELRKRKLKRDQSLYWKNKNIRIYILSSINVAIFMQKNDRNRLGKSISNMNFFENPSNTRSGSHWRKNSGKAKKTKNKIKCFSW